MNKKHIGLIVAVVIVGVMAAATFSKSGTAQYTSVRTTTVTTVSTTTSPSSPVSSPAVKTYTMADVSAHASQSSCWTTINGKVYDLTSWISEHPGGPEAILSICGIDGTAAFENQHGGNSRANDELATFFIGDLSQ